MYFAASGLALLAVGLAYYAFQLWSQQRKTTAELATTRSEVVQLQREKVETGQRVTVQDQQLEQVTRKLSEVSRELAVARARLDELSEEREEISERLAEFTRMTEQFKRMIDSGQLEVVYRRGRMIVQLPAQVLFPSGSADLTDEGQTAIRDVAKVLRKMRNRRFIVGGHTDSVPVSNESFRSNWELSAARAVNVTESLIKAGLNSKQLVAAGFAEHDPVAPNSKKLGRQKNRRIEIVLEPQLKPLPELADLETAAKQAGSKKPPATKSAGR